MCFCWVHVHASLLEEKRALHRQRQALLDENKKRGQELREVDEKFDDLYKVRGDSLGDLPIIDSSPTLTRHACYHVV